MKVFGFDDTGACRGELLSTQLDSFAVEHEEWPLGWEFASRSFAKAKTELLREMQENNADPELIKLVRQLRARDIPEEEA
ncbi:hypothetical protein AWR38_00575 [Idiomarina sp. WRN-38]|jgi:hypothetical protein|uniref:hypothetical protein n=1 Tax=Halomonas sp. 15WGF TaxID=2570357 RepID=UPI0007336139|nr:hypothetical protein [Halomonas sp. 15WGF]KTG26295.1 hypothetical protein AUR68_00570 [Idiomarina sp. H105]OAE97935.1 hypothetical protein AWR38_00575 [Idiomarina sp. WRN-38]TKJ11134.1 hypothetical protein E8Q34_07400 [Halomonas sp. 15WGF]